MPICLPVCSCAAASMFLRLRSSGETWIRLLPSIRPSRKSRAEWTGSCGVQDTCPVARVGRVWTRLSSHDNSVKLGFWRTSRRGDQIFENMGLPQLALGSGRGRAGARLCSCLVLCYSGPFSNSINLVRSGRHSQRRAPPRQRHPVLQRARAARNPDDAAATRLTPDRRVESVTRVASREQARHGCRIAPMTRAQTLRMWAQARSDAPRCAGTRPPAPHP